MLDQSLFCVSDTCRKNIVNLNASLKVGGIISYMYNVSVRKHIYVAFLYNNRHFKFVKGKIDRIYLDMYDSTKKQSYTVEVVSGIQTPYVANKSISKSSKFPLQIFLTTYLHSSFTSIKGEGPRGMDTVGVRLKNETVSLRFHCTIPNHRPVNSSILITRSKRRSAERKSRFQTLAGPTLRVLK